MLGNKIKVLVFMREGYEDLELFLENNFECRIFEGNWGDEFPKEIGHNSKNIIISREIIDPDFKIPCTITEQFEVDWIISWLCPWKIPESILKYAKKGAINFHPGPPKYPGIGCYNYAIWNEDKEYSVTTHFMNGLLDNGKIINTLKVPILENDTILTLKNRSINYLKVLFYTIMDEILNGSNFIPIPNVEWGEYKSRKDFQEFCEIKMSDFMADWNGNYDISEIDNKLRATYFKEASDGPYIEINNQKWRLIPEEDL